MITQKRAMELLDYQKESGLFVWKTRVAKRVHVGDVAGYVDSLGYRHIRLDGKLYKAHRIVWLYHYGYLPEYDMDHVNRDRSDNRIENLREVNRQCNTRNVGLSRANTSGVKGISYHYGKGKWEARITVGKHQIHLCTTNDFLEAVYHRLAAEQAEGWAGCDDCSPAFRYIKENTTC